MWDCTYSYKLFCKRSIYVSSICEFYGVRGSTCTCMNRSRMKLFMAAKTKKLVVIPDIHIFHQIYQIYRDYTRYSQDLCFRTFYTSLKHRWEARYWTLGVIYRYCDNNSDDDSKDRYVYLIYITPLYLSLDNSTWLL